MRRLALLVLTLAVTLSMVAMGCQEQSKRRMTPHERYRAVMYDRVQDADIIGFADDVDACFLQEQPTHLTTWYHR